MSIIHVKKIFKRQGTNYKNLREDSGGCGTGGPYDRRNPSPVQHEDDRERGNGIYPSALKG